MPDWLMHFRARVPEQLPALRRPNPRAHRRLSPLRHACLLPRWHAKSHTDVKQSPHPAWRLFPGGLRRQTHSPDGSHRM